jgi:hypothetical protein
LFKFKKGENINHRNTLSISRINQPKFGGGLKFEPDPRGIGFAFHRAGTGIGQKGVFFKVLLNACRPLPVFFRFFAIQNILLFAMSRNNNKCFHLIHKNNNKGKTDEDDKIGCKKC